MWTVKMQIAGWEKLMEYTVTRKKNMNLVWYSLDAIRREFLIALSSNVVSFNSR